MSSPPTPTMPSSSSLLTSMPSEVTEYILKHCHARDVGRVSQTCRDMHKLIYPSDDNYLWRELFLIYPFDDPRTAVLSKQDTSDTTDWKGELQRRVKAERVLFTDPAGLKGQGHIVALALSTAIFVVDSARPAIDDDESCNIQWAQSLLTGSPNPLLTDTSFHITHPIVLQHQAHLRCYLGLTHELGDTVESTRRLKVIRRESRAYVYNLRHYARNTLWGPYAVWDGQVVANWVHLNHIMNVVIMNIRSTPSEWNSDVWPKWGLDSTRAYSASNCHERNPRDWAGVEGIWRRVVCFMDYRYDHASFSLMSYLRTNVFVIDSDLQAFNVIFGEQDPRNPAFFDRDPFFSEAIRLMEIELKLKEKKDVPDITLGADTSFVDPERPTLFFEGKTRGAYTSGGLVEGSVRMQAPGVIRWNFTDQITAYDGNVNSWSAEGVQIGNVCSALGMGGIWTVTLHEGEDDPAGPFWMWKVEDNLQPALLFLDMP
ncbi:hypothetical protein EIP86_009855 [Pleurotus ostreatoroseus]|nr:hypothetical protein EIP86_009855 [Pleurotus ostreatoroseus]